MDAPKDIDIYKITTVLFIEREIDQARIRDLEAKLNASEKETEAMESLCGNYKRGSDAARTLYDNDREGFNRTLTELDAHIKELLELNSKRLAEIVQLRFALDNLSDATLELAGEVLAESVPKTSIVTSENQYGLPTNCISCGVPHYGVEDVYFCDPCFDADHKRGSKKIGVLFTELSEAWDRGDRDFPRLGKCAR